jgi:hypothetical protein
MDSRSDRCAASATSRTTSQPRSRPVSSEYAPRSFRNAPNFDRATGHVVPTHPWRAARPRGRLRVPPSSSSSGPISQTWRKTSRSGSRRFFVVHGSGSRCGGSKGSRRLSRRFGALAFVVVSSRWASCRRRHHRRPAPFAPWAGLPYPRGPMAFWRVSWMVCGARVACGTVQSRKRAEYESVWVSPILRIA